MFGTLKLIRHSPVHPLDPPRHRTSHLEVLTSQKNQLSQMRQPLTLSLFYQDIFLLLFSSSFGRRKEVEKKWKSCAPPSGNGRYAIRVTVLLSRTMMDSGSKKVITQRTELSDGGRCIGEIKTEIGLMQQGYVLGLDLGALLGLDPCW